MGSCVSLHKNAESALRFRVSVGSTKTKKEDADVLVPSPLKQSPIHGDYPVSVLTFKSQASPMPPLTTFRDFGSKEETFFDSRAWLDSDCDDDFLSVNGDFTPSRGNTPSCGNTPNRQSIFVGTQLNKALIKDSAPISKPEPSPRKRLSELFQESLVAADLEKLDVQTSTNETPFASGANSVCSSEITPSRESKTQKFSRTVQCCLPSFVPSCKSSEKKTLSPEKYSVV